MFLKRFYHEGLAQASYLVGCQHTGEALVVDANREVSQYVAAAQSQGMRITHVTETHIHADYLSGSRELARVTNAVLHLSGEGTREWKYAFAHESGTRLLHHNESFMVGTIRVTVLHTPGHTPEHLTFVITDTPASERPVGALTGDFIFVGDVGRPDLLERAAGVDGTMREGAAQLFQSLKRFASELPDYLQLWPGHGAGSACGKALGAVPQTTLGYERLVSWAFQLKTEKEFVEAVLSGQPDPPRYFATMKRLNRDGPPLRGAITAPPQLAPRELQPLLQRSQVIDVRPASVYAAGHIPGIINIPLTRSFIGWAGWLLDYDRDIYLLTDAVDDAVASTATNELAMIGLDRISGWFGAGAIETWVADGGRLEQVPQVDVQQLAQDVANGTVTVIDVRNDDEWQQGHIEGAHHVPLGRLSERLSELPVTPGPVVAVCQGGGRSSIATSILRAHGIQASNAPGGMTAWVQRGLPVQRDDAALSSR